VKPSAFALLAWGGLAAATFAMPRPAAAQQYWLPNGSGGTTFNNPQGSMLGTANERMLQQHMFRQQQQGRSQAPAPDAGSRSQQTAAATTADPSFRLGNNGKLAIHEIYVSASNEANWGADQLGQNILPPGSSVILRLPQGQCINDVRVVYANGQAAERRQIDTCAITDMPFP
jgi:hypothetical protein